MERVRIKQKDKGINYAQVHKNLCNRWYARKLTYRSNVEWRRGKVTRKWMAWLPGQNIQFILPSNVERKHVHLPTALDMKVFTWVLSESRRSGKSTLHVISIDAVLNAIGMVSNSRARHAVRESFEFWSRVSTRYVESWLPGKNKSLIDRRFAPLLRFGQVSKRKLRLRVNKDWRDTCANFFAMIPLDLPNEATTQNLVVMLLAWINRKKVRTTHRRHVSEICEKIGLLHRNRRTSFTNAYNEAKLWFNEHHGITLEVDVDDNDYVRFTMTTFDPRRKKPKVAGKKGRNKKRTGRNNYSGYGVFNDPRDRIDALVVRTDPYADAV